MSERVQLHQGDCFDLLETLKDGSVDAVITDPPFGTTCVGWDHKFDLGKWWEIIERKLKPTGVVTSFCCGRFTFELYASKPEWFRYDLVWEKSMAVGFLDARRKPMRAHEMVLMFAPKLNESTYNPQKWISENAVIGQERFQQAPTAIYGKFNRKQAWVDDGSRFPRSVIRFDSVGNGSKSKTKHPTQKPLDLVSWLVKTYSNENDLVVDPFFGSGTTAEACLMANRRFWGCDMSHEYLAIAQDRISRHDAIL